jgi:hypothetical protein
MKPESIPAPVQPLLARYATPRSGDPVLPGHFDSRRDVWVVDGPEGPQPIVQLRSDLGETTTATAVRAEQDDTDADPGLLASTTTFTKVLAEGDDTDVSCATLEVTTKTQAQVESEDTTFTIEAFGGALCDRSTPVRRIQ